MSNTDNPNDGLQRLIEVMRLELSLLREILHLLKEEEEALLKDEKDLAKSIVSKCSEIKKRVKEVQKERRHAIRDLLCNVTQDIDLHHFNSEVFENLVSEDDEFGVETLNLKEQILKIISRIDEQKVRNTRTIRAAADELSMQAEIAPQKAPSSKLQTLGPEEEQEKKAS